MTDKRHAEALPHIFFAVGSVTGCSECGIAIVGEVSEEMRNDFLTAHRHKDVKSLPKEL